MLNPRHIEVQILGDGTGNVVHLWDRDCSVQRRHQKVVETAPAQKVPEATRKAILDDAKRITAAAKYLCAGTVEFLVDKKGKIQSGPLVVLCLHSSPCEILDPL